MRSCGKALKYKENGPPDPQNETAAQAGPLNGGKTKYHCGGIGDFGSTEWSVAKGRTAPVRRHSYLCGRCERTFWRRTNQRDVRQIVLAARRYERAGRRRGNRNGPLGGVAIEILDLFANLVEFGTGRLEPAISAIMDKLHRSRDAVVRALKNLRTHGFLDWLRRYVSVESDGRGPQIKQTSNAYRMCLPEKARALLGRWSAALQPPDDLVQAAAERADAIEEHRSTEKRSERTLLNFDSLDEEQLRRKISQTFEQGRRRRERESARRSQYLSNLYSLITE